MTPTPPFWLLQRQIKQEPVNDTTLRLTGPNLPTYDIAVVPVTTGPGYRVSVDRVGEGGATHIAHTEVHFENIEAAWQAGYELYRQRVIV